MPTLLRTFFVLLVLALLVGGPWAYYECRERTARSFHVVEDGVLYRSGQLPLGGLKQILNEYGIRTIVSLRDGDQDDDREEEKYCVRNGIAHVRIFPRKWWASKGPPPAEEGLQAFREVMNDPANYPVLVHCFAGIHRTGAYCAVYRMDYQGWTNEEAIAEMRHIGYTTLDGDWDLSTFLENYHRRPQEIARPVSRVKTR